MCGSSRPSSANCPLQHRAKLGRSSRWPCSAMGRKSSGTLPLALYQITRRIERRVLNDMQILPAGLCARQAEHARRWRGLQIDHLGLEVWRSAQHQLARVRLQFPGRKKMLSFASVTRRKQQPFTRHRSSHLSRPSCYTIYLSKQTSCAKRALTAAKQPRFALHSRCSRDIQRDGTGRRRWRAIPRNTRIAHERHNRQQTDCALPSSQLSDST